MTDHQTHLLLKIMKTLSGARLPSTNVSMPRILTQYNLVTEDGWFVWCDERDWSIDGSTMASYLHLIHNNQPIIKHIVVEERGVEPFSWGKEKTQQQSDQKKEETVSYISSWTGGMALKRKTYIESGITVMIPFLFGTLHGTRLSSEPFDMRVKWSIQMYYGWY